MLENTFYLYTNATSNRRATQLGDVFPSQKIRRGAETETLGMLSVWKVTIPH